MYVCQVAASFSLYWIQQDYLELFCPVYLLVRSQEAMGISSQMLRGNNLCMHFLVFHI